MLAVATPMPDSRVVERVHKLLARAGHAATPPEEARSCGVIAARLMWEHEIDIGRVQPWMN